MTNHRFSILIIVVICLASCTSQKEYISASDYSYSGKFKNYKTFVFTNLSQNDSLHLKDFIEESIVSKMSAQGYKQNPHKPDLLITYRLYLDDFNFQGYDQPNLESWVNNDWEERLMKDGKFLDPLPAEGVRAEYDIQNYLMSKGTLLITFYDRRSDKTVWQGYASGVFSSQFDSSEKNLKLATAKIFKEFRLVANGYVLRKGA